MFSPPNTPVRIQGDVVGRGFAIEIEDRGLGISAARLEEINANLANPPQFDLSGSDRLGLFIAGQLAQRHEIKITLRPSVYGGTTAIVLIPTALVVDEGTFERDPELTAVPEDVLADGLSGRHAALAGAVGRPGVNGFANALGAGSPGANGFGAGAVSNGLGGAGLGGAGLGGAGLGGAGYGGSITGAGLGSGFGLADLSEGAESTNGGVSPDTTIIAGSVAESSAGPGTPAEDATSLADDAASLADAATTEAAAATGYTGGAATGFSLPEPDPESDYVRRGFSLGRRTARVAGAAGAVNPFVKPTDRPAPTPRTREPVVPPPPASEPSDARVSPDQISQLGLPVRVRQASLAPQLRDAPPAAPASENGFSGSGLAARNPGASGASPTRMPRPGSPAATSAAASPPSAQPPAAPAPAALPPAAPPAEPAPAASPTGATPASPEAARNTMSALQRGWQLGRSEADSADSVDFNVFAPRRSPSGQAFSPYDPDPGSTTSSAEADGADEPGGE